MKQQQKKPLNAFKKRLSTPVETTNQGTSAWDMPLKYAFLSLANNNHTDAVMAIRFIMAARRSMIAGLLCGLISGLLTIAILQPSYRAFVTLKPATGLNTGTQIPAGAKNIALLRSLTQSASSPDLQYFEEFLANLSAPETADALLKDPKILTGLRRSSTFKWLPNTTHWTPQKLSAYIKAHIHIDQKPTSNLTTLSYWHPDPNFATYFLQRLDHITNTTIKNQEQRTAKKRKAYLITQRDRTLNNDHKRIINQLLMEQERLLMLSAIDEPFAAKAIAKPDHFYKAQWPNKPVIMLCFMILGLGSGMLYYRIKQSMRLR